jgi:hypothetical protein
VPRRYSIAPSGDTRSVRRPPRRSARAQPAVLAEQPARRQGAEEALRRGLRIADREDALRRGRLRRLRRRAGPDRGRARERRGDGHHAANVPEGPPSRVPAPGTAAAVASTMDVEGTPVVRLSSASPRPTPR